MKKTLLVVVVLIFTLCAFFFTLSSLGFDKIAHAVSTLSLPALILFVFASLVNFTFMVYRWEAILQAGEKASVSTLQLFWYRMVAYTVSYLVPSAQLGGEPFRVYFLEQNKIPRKKAVASVILDKVFELSITVIFTAIGFGLVIFRGADFNVASIIAIGLAVLFLSIFYYLTIFHGGFFTTLVRILKLHKVTRFATFVQKIQEMEELMQKFFHQHTFELIASISISVLSFLVIILEYWIVLHFLGQHASFAQLLIISTIPMIAYAIPVPGAVGALEFSQLAAFTVAGLDPVLGITALLVIRARDLVFIVIGTAYASSHGIHILRKNTNIKPLA